MRFAALVAGLGAVGATLAAQHTVQMREWQIDLPASWRQLTPDEARTLRQNPAAGIPAELIQLMPADQHPWGEIDRWLQGGFDGRALAARVDEEQDLDDATIANLRRQWERPREAGGPGARVEASRVTQVGRDGHPAIELVVRLPEAGAIPPATELQYYVPTGGRFVMLRMRAHERDFAAATAFYRPLVDSLRFARRQRGGSQRVTDFLYALGVGVVIVAILLGVHRRVRRAPPQ